MRLIISNHVYGKLEVQENAVEGLDPLVKGRRIEHRERTLEWNLCRVVGCAVSYYVSSNTFQKKRFKKRNAKKKWGQVCHV